MTVPTATSHQDPWLLDIKKIIKIMTRAIEETAALSTAIVVQLSSAVITLLALVDKCDMVLHRSPGWIDNG